MLVTGDRINLILLISDFLKHEHDWDRIGFILSSYGIDLSPNDPLERDLDAASDEVLIEMAQFLKLELPASVGQFEQTVPTATATATSAEPLFIFASHLTKHKELVGDVNRALATYGITMFVAHETIEHDKLWQDEIENALDRADAGVVFVHEGLKNSPWCDQEIGWMQGRHVPVMALKFDTPPHGFLGKYQAQQMPSGATAQQVAELTLERIAARPELAEKFTASLVSAMQNSGSYYTTDNIWKRLRDRTIADPSVALILLDALKFNRQVHHAECRPDGRRLYVEVVVEFLQRQPCADAIAAEVDRYIAYRDEVDPVEQYHLMQAFYDERDGKRPATA